MRRVVFALASALALAGVFAVASTVTAKEDAKILKFETMTPVVAPWLGAANPIRGINGGGQAWRIAEGKGELSASGRLEVEVKGLVLVSTGNTGAVATFTAALNCLTKAQPRVGETQVSQAVTVGPNGPGNAKIKAQFSMPTPCVAPIVFVGTGGTPAAFRWFATTGN